VVYRHLSLLQLADRIAHEGDGGALDELHDHRRLFHYRGDELLRLAEYVDRLRLEGRNRSWPAGDPEILDSAYDLTISKFSNLPSGRDDGAAHSGKARGPDCRCYFKAFVEYVRRKGGLDNRPSELERERIAAGLFQNVVTRHFFLSCLECRRSRQKLARRYLWKVNGSVLPVWLPLEIPSGESRAWLEANVEYVEPRRPGERDRVQAVVDELAARIRIVSLDTAGRARAIALPDKSGRGTENDTFIEDLAETVAEGKVRHIGRQRPAIQRLGVEKLRGLIHQVFDDLAMDCYEPSRMADRFGLSRATMSRFAGTRWSGRRADVSPTSVPDLWRNTAKALAADDRFMTVARLAGLAGRVEQVLGSSSITSNSVSHE